MASLITFRRLVVPFPLLMAVDGVNADSGLNTNAIETAIGTAGQVQGDVYKISLPRTDLSISIDDVKLSRDSPWAAGSCSRHMVMPPSHTAISS
jgi:hypothetical protein